ncbi:polysaccharide biosynthesis protein [Lishizhenia sp.]|uniref:polysaccharide biosynthesis protein n=1 Tax=Lishizhenia sp. TaxID=2497594 RepID=UPI00299EF6AC|nr:polysaccharide biosynthesis protein [Lishizhenia sp.]MDX1446806.1 polysaccharide biosynthesis protein [Lishizhenia sp.]
MNLIDIPNFIKEYITKRPESLFVQDIERNKEILTERIKGKSVLVIGGAGTIGSSYIKAVLKFEPAKLYVVDTNENGLTELTRTLRSDVNQFVPEDYKTYPMNFGDPVFKKMFLAEGPFDIVANFAAHKHVRSEKDKYSIEAMIDNNVFKAKEFLDMLLENKPEHFFCVSTDKAANPVNVMGASKKLMEEVIMAYSDKLQITTARFANVAFSNGSLLAGYVERLFQNQPISCPADVKRFFVSPEESGQICMLACMLGESSDIYFPKLAEEEMVYFKDITLDFFKASNRPILECKNEQEAKEKALVMTEKDPYPVYFFESDTSGEKLYEEFYTDTDKVDFDKHNALGVVKNAKKLSIAQIEDTITDLKGLLNSGDYDKSSIVNVLKKYLPDFEHIETGKSLDQKM